jgi:hypothetical protein
MFILYAVVIGFLVGLALGGRPAGLATLQFRFGWLVIVGFAAQIVLFSAPVSERVGSLGPVLYVASTALVFVALLANVRIAGLPLVALGAACNLAAIVANGGYMPASSAALAAIGKGPIAGYSNSSVVTDPVLAPLTDIFALPTWLPFTNVFSIGDVLIAIGIAIAVVAAMRRQPAATSLRPT